MSVYSAAPKKFPVCVSIHGNKAHFDYESWGPSAGSAMIWHKEAEGTCSEAQMWQFVRAMASMLNF